MKSDFDNELSNHVITRGDLDASQNKIDQLQCEYNDLLAQLTQYRKNNKNDLVETLSNKVESKDVEL